MSISVAAARRAEHAAGANRTVLGFWIYLMTDCILFAALFATYAVMRGATDGGPSGAALFSLPYVLVETLLLLTSSFVCGLAMIALQRGKKDAVLQLLFITFVLGAAFVGLEINEFRHLISEGHDWARSGFLSSFFTLVGTHGLHICVGLVWLSVLFVQIFRKGLGGNTPKRMTLFSMFWHFLDVVWIFIFSIVYLWSGLV
ncbi:MAG TPA: cytochrome o ubiquinol oxidase subunit III [Candidatus Saccharimonadales bacterium]